MWLETGVLAADTVVQKCLEMPARPSVTSHSCWGNLTGSIFRSRTHVDVWDSYRIEKLVRALFDLNFNQEKTLVVSYSGQDMVWDKCCLLQRQECDVESGIRKHTHSLFCHAWRMSRSLQGLVILGKGICQARRSVCGGTSRQRDPRPFHSAGKTLRLGPEGQVEFSLLHH